MLFKSLLQTAAVGASLMCSASAATVQKAKRQDSMLTLLFLK
jgi:hypothetical protein